MHRPLLTLVLCSLSLAPTIGEEYKTADDARAVGYVKIRSKNYTEAIAPLEKALEMTPSEDRKNRCEIYRTLMVAYRHLPEIDKMQQAVEYIQLNDDSRPSRSNIATNYASFLHQRGKDDWAEKHYEDVLKKDPRDPTALAVLVNLYRFGDREDRKRFETLDCQLEKLNNERSVKKAERMEAMADKDKDSAASNWKDIARTWLEAGEKAKAEKATEKARQAPPETRSKLLTMMWHEGMADNLVKIGDHAAALKEYEAALKLTDEKLKPIQTSLEKKIKETKAAQAEAASAESKPSAAKS